MNLPQNPYLNRSMIRSTSAFYGRRREVVRLAQRLTADPPQSAAIVGDRRIGKSSLLYHLTQRQVMVQYLDDPDRYAFLFLDFQEERRLSVERFFASLFRHLQGALQGRYEIRATPDYDGMRSVVDDLDRAGIKLILLLDEFDRVTRSSSFDADFYAALRSLAGHHNLAFLSSSSRDLQQLCHTQEIADSPFFNIFSTVYLGPMQRDEALELIRQPGVEPVYPVAEHTELIIDLGGFLPFFLQIACSSVFELHMEGEECRAEQVTQRFLEEARPHFQFFWGQMDAVERALCHELACGRPVDPGRAEYQDLVRRGFALEGRLFSSGFAEYVREICARQAAAEPAEVQAERLRSMEEELETARRMQVGLLPQEKPRIAGLDVVGRVLPASHVGGDFYTYLWLDELWTRLAIVAVDVMGHGMEGAVTAMRFSETLRYEARGRTDPAEILGGLNRALCGELAPHSFVGCCIGVIEAEGRWLEVGIGGYHPPLRYSRVQDQVIDLEMGNLPLGIRSDTEYRSVGLALHDGDLLLFHSDGLIEAQDDRQANYGAERLRELLLQAGREGMEAEALLERLFWDVGRFTASAAAQDDDITAIVVRVKGP